MNMGSKNRTALEVIQREFGYKPFTVAQLKTRPPCNDWEWERKWSVSGYVNSLAEQGFLVKLEGRGNYRLARPEEWPAPIDRTNNLRSIAVQLEAVLAETYRNTALIEELLREWQGQ